MYNWTNTTLPKLTDYLNNSSKNVAQIFTVVWVNMLGGLFFATILGVIASVLYIKTKKVMVPIAIFAIGNLLLGAVMPTNFLYIIGLIVAFSLGFMLYQLFVEEE